jgi:hypothetical protein
VQGGHWHTPQTCRYALDQARLQRHHCSPLLKTQWSFSRLLGVQIRMQGGMTRHFLGVHPGCFWFLSRKFQAQKILDRHIHQGSVTLCRTICNPAQE